MKQKAGSKTRRNPATSNAKKTAVGSDKIAGLNKLLPELEALYKEIHSHPELSMQETRTARNRSAAMRAVRDYAPLVTK